MLRNLTLALSCSLLFVLCEGPEQSSQNDDFLEMTLTEGTNMAVALSPRGDTIAFDLLGRIWLMPAEGGESVPITDPFGNARQPSWSPDGKMIAFQAYWDGNGEQGRQQPSKNDLRRF